MGLNIDIPDNLKPLFADLGNDLADAVRESAFVDLYRRGKLSQSQLASALGLARVEIDAVLARHHVTEDLSSKSELDLQLAKARRKMCA